MKFKLIIPIAFLLISNLNFAQQRVCGTGEFMNEKLQDSIFRKNYESRQESVKNFQKNFKSNSLGRRQTIIVPVAVHFPTAEESIRSCLVDLVKDQIRILNEDFSGMNSDISNWNEASSHYPGVNIGNLDVKFILASKNHPENTDEDLLEGEPAVTIGWPFDESDRDSRWSGYQNFVVKDLGGAVLGYSPKGGEPGFGDTLVITNTAFGSGEGCEGFVPRAPFNLGRTLTHELGHFYNLDHTWGGNGSCDLDDGIADTPNISGPTYGCAVPGSITMCNNASLTTNYMDYVNDECMYMFTEGQSMNMNAYLTIIQNEWKLNVVDETIDNDDDDPVIITDDSKGFKIYPNPVNEEVVISMPNEVKGFASYTLHDLSGKLIYEKTINIEDELNEIKINTSQFNTGLYVLDFKSSDFSKIMKLIVKH